MHLYYAAAPGQNAAGLRSPRSGLVQPDAPANAGSPSRLHSGVLGPAWLRSPFGSNMKRRLIPVLAPEALASMPTKQLLGRLRSLQQCEESVALSDRTPEEVATTEGVLFKNTTEWQTAYADLKAILAMREHVPSAAERDKARRQGAKKKPNTHMHWPRR